MNFHTNNSTTSKSFRWTFLQVFSQMTFLCIAIFLLQTKHYTPTKSMEPCIRAHSSFMGYSLYDIETGGIYGLISQSSPFIILSKRIIGTGGDHIKCVEGKVEINGKLFSRQIKDKDMVDSYIFA